MYRREQFIYIEKHPHHVDILCYYSIKICSTKLDLLENMGGYQYSTHIFNNVLHIILNGVNMSSVLFCEEINLTLNTLTKRSYAKSVTHRRPASYQAPPHRRQKQSDLKRNKTQ